MSGPYDQHLAFSQAYDYNNQYQSYNQSAYPSEGFSNSTSYQTQPYHNPQTYYPDTRGYPADNSNQYSSGTNASYYNSTNQAGAQGPEADRGLLGAMAGGAAGGFGGHKVGHGVLGALGGAILGSLTEDYAKKGKKHGKQGKHGKHQQHQPQYQQQYQPGYRHESNSNAASSNSAMSGLAPIASSFFNHKK